MRMLVNDVCAMVIPSSAPTGLQGLANSVNPRLRHGLHSLGPYRGRFLTTPNIPLAPIIRYQELNGSGLICAIRVRFIIGLIFHKN